ncbi:cyclic nucleotide-binding domain-containing protein [Anaerorhabdus sp.]|uniref:cyclic nucleotide-binding domain-containing protein n=1 Tax=Anaerorhabdus sp. TaxID=1872524 RepID=UPI002FC6F7EC
MIKAGLTKEHKEMLLTYGLLISNLDSCYVASYKQGEYITQENNLLDWIGIVIQGKAKVCCTSANGKNLVLCYFISSGIIGGLEMMTNTPNATASMIALTDFKCIVIPSKNNCHLLKQNVHFLNQLCFELSNSLVRSSNNFVSSSLHTGEQRLCSYILEVSYKNLFRDVLTDVACSIGLSYRHMFRILNQLCRDGILEKKQSGYQIINKKQLELKAINKYNT